MSKLSPAFIFLSYWVFCLLLYAFGPLKWVTYSPFLFWSLNISFLILFVVGWMCGKGIKHEEILAWNRTIDSQYIMTSLNRRIIINFVYEFVNIFRSFLLSSFDITGLVIKITDGFMDMGHSYNSFQENVNVDSAGVVGGMIVTLLNYVWDFWAFSTLLLSILYFKKTKLPYKVLSILTFVIVIVGYIARGTNIGVFRIVLAFLVFSYIRYMKKCGNIKHNQVNTKKNTPTRFIILCCISIVAVVVLFDRIMQSRGGILSWEDSSYNIGGIGINKDSIFFKILPDSFHMLLVALTGYLSQGFYGMSLTLMVPWKPMFGLGSSMAIQNALSNFFPKIKEFTYQSRIECFGWDSYSQWHSMYSWFANDVSYVGVIFVMGLIGFLFSVVYNDCLRDDNPYAFLMLYYLFLMAIFLPCNNQLFQSTYVMFSFIVVLNKWLITRKGISLHFGDIIRL